MDEIVNLLRNEFNRIKDVCHEGNLQYYVVINTFLKYYGYDIEHLEIEKRIVKGFCDIYVPTIGNEALIVEVKTGKESLELNDITQAINYASFRQQRFAILTNGKEYALLDSHIKTDPKDGYDALKSYIVFWFDIFKTKEKGITKLKFFKYLSFENLYEKKTTHFYCDIARYREWKCEQGMKEASWTVYRCTLYQFFDFYAQKKVYKREFESEGKQCYENLGIEDFKEFIKDRKRNKDKSSKKTIESNFSHVYDMLHELKKHGRINNIILSESRKQNLFEYEQTNRKKEFGAINAEEIRMVISFLEKGKNANRNIVVFLLTISLGLERSQLLELVWDSFDKKLRYIIIDGRKIEMCGLLQKYLSLLFEESKAKKKKLPYVLQTYSGKKYKRISEWGINNIFDKLTTLTNDSKWRDYSPKYLRHCLIMSMIESEYPLEEIIYVTGIDIKNITNYITTDMILARKNIKINWNKLYSGALCEVAL